MILWEKDGLIVESAGEELIECVDCPPECGGLIACVPCIGGVAPAEIDVTIPTGHWTCQCGPPDHCDRFDGKKRLAFSGSDSTGCAWTLENPDYTGEGCRCDWIRITLLVRIDGPDVLMEIVLQSFTHNKIFSKRYIGVVEIDCNFVGVEIPFERGNGDPANCLWDDVGNDLGSGDETPLTIDSVPEVPAAIDLCVCAGGGGTPDLAATISASSCELAGLYLLTYAGGYTSGPVVLPSGDTLQLDVFCDGGATKFRLRVWKVGEEGTCIDYTGTIADGDITCDPYAWTIDVDFEGGCTDCFGSVAFTLALAVAA